jgi:hypothetical protein
MRKIMKKLVVSILFITSLFCTIEATVTVNVAYDPAISSMPIEDLRNVRLKENQEQEHLLKLIQTMFSVERACEAIGQLSSAHSIPHIVLWFTNYFGSVMAGTVSWYNNNILSQIPNSLFWLTDLKAWCFLTNNKSELKKIYKDIVAKIENNERLSAQECPLIIQSSSVLTPTINDIKPRYNALVSKEFFIWLSQLQGFTIGDLGDVANKLCKSYIRSDRLHFSLASIGYFCPFLDYRLEKLENNTLLDVDFAYIFRILQYLEGIYYVYTIVQKSLAANPDLTDISIVFLLPNKEFVYYLVEEEETLFQTFQENTAMLLSKYIPRDIAVNLYFQPFGYGDSFSDVPYKAPGTSYKKPRLEQELW